MDIGDLTQKKCVACEGGVAPLTHGEIEAFLTHLATPWEVVDDKKIRRSFEFKNFIEAMQFVDGMARIAESEGHHPDFCVHYNRVEVELTTHAIGGLFENDFILAAKIEALINVLKKA